MSTTGESRGGRPDRAILPRVQWLLRAAPVVCLVGMRGSGISRLLKECEELRDWQVLDLTLHGDREQLRRDPEGLLGSRRGWVLRDVHLEPSLLEVVRRAVDRSGRAPGQFLLTSRLDLRSLPEARRLLQARSVQLEVPYPSLAERHGEGRVGGWTGLFTTPSDRWGSHFDWRQVLPGTLEEVIRGPQRAPERSVSDWHRLVGESLDRDLLAHRRGMSAADLHLLLAAALEGRGELLNRAALARRTGLSRPTVHRYIDLLVGAFLLRLLPAFVPPGSVRPVRSPRLHAPDPALARALVGGRGGGRMADLGAVVHAELDAWRCAELWPPRLYHWGIHTGMSVPFILERNGRFLPISLSESDRPTSADARSVMAFRDRLAGASPGGLVLHCGNHSEPLGPGVWAIPWWRLT